MKTLFIDTHCSKNFNIGYLENDNLKIEEGTDASIQLIEKIEKLTQNNFQEIIILKGPGSLTGLRIGSALALGISAGKKIPIKGLTIWDLLLPLAQEIYFHTGTKKWVKKTETTEEILEITEIKDTNKKWISNKSQELTNQLNIDNNIQYPNIIELMAKFKNKASSNIDLLYPVTLF